MRTALVLTILAAAHAVQAFLASPSRLHHIYISNHQEYRPYGFKPSFDIRSPTLCMSNVDEENATYTSKSETILQEFHKSKFTFRIVVIGNGAILETTSKLGPKTSTSTSPKTGDKLMTFANEDASFEFHVKCDQICMITFVSSNRPDGVGGMKVMRVARFLNETGTPMCSLILADSSPEAIEWFEGMAEKYGQEAIM